MEMPSNFCGFRTAYLLPINVDWAEKITDLIINDLSELFEIDKGLLYGWSLKATGISGAAGFILEFEFESPPVIDDLIYIEKAIMAFGGNTEAKKWIKDYIQ